MHSWSRVRAGSRTAGQRFRRTCVSVYRADRPREGRSSVLVPSHPEGRGCPGLEGRELTCSWVS